MPRSHSNNAAKATNVDGVRVGPLPCSTIVIKGVNNTTSITGYWMLDRELNMAAINSSVPV